jgi:hypothetical protein
LKIPASAWPPAVETGGEVRDGAWVAELTGDVLEGWSKGMRLIVRKERPHPGAQLRINDADGMRVTCFATNTADRPIAQLELRHRLRARAEDRIRAARATGLRNLPLHDTAQNKVWLEIVQLALHLLAWMPMLALTGHARLWEPRRLRFRLFSVAGQLVTTGRRRILRLARHWPWTGEVTTALRGNQSRPEQWNPASTRDDTRALHLPTNSHSKRNGPPTTSADRHERSRLRTRGLSSSARRRIFRSVLGCS